MCVQRAEIAYFILLELERKFAPWAEKHRTHSEVDMRSDAMARAILSWSNIVPPDKRGIFPFEEQS